MKKELKPTLSERTVFLFNPEKGNEMFRERVRKAQEPGKNITMATGYGNHGASKTLNSMIGWLAGGGSAEDDIDLHGSTLRVRARDLYAGGGLAKSGPDTLTTNVVGWGIQPKPKVDAELLGLSDEAADEWQRNTLREFQLWAKSKFCDAEQVKDFYTMQQTAFLNWLVSGDVFGLMGMTPNPATPYQTTIRILEADRVSTPETEESEAKETEGGGRIVDGIEIDREGRVIRYYITNRHPLAESSSVTLEWAPIEAYGKDTGLPNILHVMKYERPEQRRGVPFVASQMELIKQLDRYLNSELAANVVAAMLTVFLQSDEDDGVAGMDDAVEENEKVTDSEMKLELAPGAIYDLPPGKKVNTVNPLRANTGFESFVTTLETVIGASMGIPKEVLLHKYDSNYTAARSALLDFWKMVRVYRSIFNAQFNQPIYEAWLAEAVAIGRVEAPGFFDDPAIRAAWCGCLWMGASMGHVDPLKEVNAARERIALNISTEEQEASEYNGNDWASNIRQRKKEAEAAKELLTAAGAQQDGTEEEEEEQE